jgi:hypothetical protein
MSRSILDRSESFDQATREGSGKQSSFELNLDRSIIGEQVTNRVVFEACLENFLALLKGLDIDLGDFITDHELLTTINTN